MDWLVKNGVDQNRLIGKGYGESLLVNKCADGVKCSEEEHQANRRSEFIITALQILIGQKEGAIVGTLFFGLTLKFLQKISLKILQSIKSKQTFSKVNYQNHPINKIG